MILKLSSGHRLVYKPRALSIDEHFRDLLKWCNLHGFKPCFRLLKQLNFGDHGWVEFIEAKSCKTEKEVRRFYKRQGGFLFLMYALQATDFHYENLIASGEYPFLVDLESLFHPHIQSTELKGADFLANQIMSHSVLRPGFLPRRQFIGDDKDGYDISGLTDVSGQQSPFAVPYVENSLSDEMRIERKRMEMTGGKNQPDINGSKIDSLAYEDDIEKGFSLLYKIVMKNKNEFLNTGGPIQAFRGSEVRFILRNTRTYVQLKYETMHPDTLRDALDRDCYFDRLWWLTQHLPGVKDVIIGEIESIWQGDIPYFFTTTDSNNLCDGMGKCFPGFFKDSSMNTVLKHIGNLNKRDLQRQLWFIKGAMASLKIEAGHSGFRKYIRPSEASLAAFDTKLLKAEARKIGNYLETLALKGEEDGSVTWLGLILRREKFWELAPLGIDLYNGIPGIILFLAYLGEVTGEKRYTFLAKSAMITVHKHLEKVKEVIKTIGVFSGWGGLIYLMTHLGILWREDELLDNAVSISKRFPDLIKEDKEFDITSGSSGGIAALSCLYECRPSDILLETMIKCGDWLIQNAKSMEKGLGWIITSMGCVPLAGFSHGAAGVSWALSKLFSYTKEERFIKVAWEAIKYERTLFSTQAGNWHDLRSVKIDDNNNEKELPMNFPIAWCNGAPGIGLGRLDSLPVMEDNEIYNEIQIALKTTALNGIGLNHSFCHGDLGNIELIHQAGHVLKESYFLEQTRRLSSLIIKSIEENGWLCGTPLGTETPGLMTGLAGIGYGLLRLAEPDWVPSVLLLKPPIIKR